MPRLAPALALALLAATGCQAQRSTAAPPTESPSSEPSSGSAFDHRELAIGYALGLTLFDRGEYERAAGVFVQVFLELEPDPTGDQLRHLLVQHIGWSLLGSFDVSGNEDALDRGEATLERYLAKHEELFPDAQGEREVIYELLGEYALRRAGEPPPDANERIVALVEDTQSSFRRTLPPTRHVLDDGPIRIIEVETLPWATLDDPEVAALFRDPRFLGPSLYDRAGEPLNHTRVLVRGFVRRAKVPPGRRPVHLLLKAARPATEECYESALGRGAGIVERVRVDLSWDGTGLADVEIAGDHGLDPAAVGCVVEALRDADQSSDRPGPAYAELDLTFFVDRARPGPGKNELDTDSFGPFGQPKRGVPWVEL